MTPTSATENLAESTQVPPRSYPPGEHPHPRSNEERNVGETERIASAAAGAALLLLALARRRLTGLLLGVAGAALVSRAATGKCSVYRALGISSASSGRPGVPDNLGRKIERSILILRRPEEVFRFWCDFKNLPRFMPHVKRVDVLDERRSHWVVEAPGGRAVEWDAEIINEHPNELIAWESLPGSEVESAGSVRFHPTPDGRGTELRITMQYNPTGGLLGLIATRLSGGYSPEAQVEEALTRLKQLMEPAELPAPAPGGSPG